MSQNEYETGNTGTGNRKTRKLMRRTMMLGDDQIENLEALRTRSISAHVRDALDLMISLGDLEHEIAKELKETYPALTVRAGVMHVLSLWLMSRNGDSKKDKMSDKLDRLTSIVERIEAQGKAGSDEDIA